MTWSKFWNTSYNEFVATGKKRGSLYVNKCRGDAPVVYFKYNTNQSFV